jgi:hypothetical protein
MSPAWQESGSQIAASVEKRIVRALHGRPVGALLTLARPPS